MRVKVVIGEELENEPGHHNFARISFLYTFNNYLYIFMYLMWASFDFIDHWSLCDRVGHLAIESVTSKRSTTNKGVF